MRIFLFLFPVVWSSIKPKQALIARFEADSVRNDRMSGASGEPLKLPTWQRGDGIYETIELLVDHGKDESEIATIIENFHGPQKIPHTFEQIFDELKQENNRNGGPKYRIPNRTNVARGILNMLRRSPPPYECPHKKLRRP